MLLDWRFSADYYLRIIELAIRDGSRVLIYNKEQHSLEAWPAGQALSANQDGGIATLHRVTQELFSHSTIAYSISSRLLSIIDLRIRQEQRSTGLFTRLFSRRQFAARQRTIHKLQSLKNIIFFERQRPVNKVSSLAASVLQKEPTMFSSWEEFSYQVSVSPEETVPTTRIAQESISSDATSQMIIEALLAFLENQTTYLPLSLELLNQFLAEKTIQQGILSPKIFSLVQELQNLFLSSHEDFQTLLSRVLTDPLISAPAELFSAQGKAQAQAWIDAINKNPQDLIFAQAFLARVVRAIVNKGLKAVGDDEQEASPEQIGSIYSIRDRSPSLWTKMIHILLLRWLLDFDQEVFYALKKELRKHMPRQSFFDKLKLSSK